MTSPMSSTVWDAANPLSVAQRFHGSKISQLSPPASLSWSAPHCWVASGADDELSLSSWSLSIVSTLNHCWRRDARSRGDILTFCRVSCSLPIRIRRGFNRLQMDVMRRQLIPQKHLAHPVSFFVDGQHLSSTHQVANSSAYSQERKSRYSRFGKRS